MSAGGQEPKGEKLTRRDTRARFEQWAKNPACGANAASAVLGVPMRDVALLEGALTPFGQSPFAIARGLNFERTLLREGAARLLEALREAKVLPTSAEGLVDLRTRSSGGPCRGLEESLARTHEHLAATADRKPSEALLAGATLRIAGDVMLPEAILVVDAVVVRRDLSPVQLVVGEIKTYPDRGGYTDGGELATARAQAGVYAMALRACIEDFGLSPRVTVSDRGFLVLSRPGSNMPSVRGGEDLRYQIERARRGFERLRRVAATTPRPVEPDTARGIVQRAETQYGDGCLSFCERANVCRDRALVAGDGCALGDEMSHWLGATKLPRALELLEGARAQTAAEEDLVARMRDSGARR